jgi:hypothetical protein
MLRVALLRLLLRAVLMAGAIMLRALLLLRAVGAPHALRAVLRLMTVTFWLLMGARLRSAMTTPLRAEVATRPRAFATLHHGRRAMTKWSGRHETMSHGRTMMKPAIPLTTIIRPIATTTHVRRPAWRGEVLLRHAAKRKISIATV